MRALLLLFCFLFSQVQAQNWVEMMQNPNVNVKDVKNEFEKYWKSQPDKNGKGWKAYRRWEHFMEPRVYPSGERFNPAIAYEEYNNYLNNPANFKNETGAASVQATANWTLIGPTTYVPNNGGAGRVNCIRFHPTNSNIMYAGSPSGGLWKSTNGGASWSTNTDALASIGVTDIAIDPINTNIMYLGTGDGESMDTYSLGVLKSIDGGSTWNTTGLSWTQSQVSTISKLLIDPVNTSNLLAATNGGIYRTTNSGTTWVKVLNGASVKDLEFKPGNTSIIYASSTTAFYRSVDSGASFSAIASGLPSTTSVSRLAIAVTPADSNYVYVLASKSYAGTASDYKFYGLYRSIDGGTTFTLRSNTPNILGRNSTGSDQIGQGWFDLAIAASPLNKDLIFCGGINTWKSTNGGTSWSISTHWTGTGADYVHADFHDLIFLPGSGTTLFAGCDGGVFKTTNTGVNWTDISNNLQIGQVYRIGLSATNPNLFLTGWQDNHTVLYSGFNTWDAVVSGDGMDCFIDWSNNNYMYASAQYGDFLRSSNGGSNWVSIVSGLTEYGGWVTPWIMDPTNSQVLYAGLVNVWKSSNRGTNWSKLSTLPGGGEIVSLAVAPSNTQYIYVARSTGVYRSTTGGSAWTAIATGLPISFAAITDLAVSTTNPDELWITFSGYSSPNKVFTSVNGGSNWSNISSGLPNLPVNCITYHNIASKGIYVGTDIGVYYRDNSTSGWVNYMNGLPNVVVNDLEIYYNTNKIRAATYGRGIWESNLSVNVGVEETKTAGTPIIYPNPNDGSFDLSFFGANPDDYSITITNAMGQSVYKESLTQFSGNYSNRINLDAYGSGVYFLSINSSTGIMTQKFIAK